MSSAAFLPKSFVDRLVADGFSRAEPGVLQPAEPFLDVMGEALRQRVFLTTGAEGRELCLRPDFTIPTALAHIAAGVEGEACYFYEGPVFRHGVNGGETPQAGVEIFGASDRTKADARVVALAVEASRALGVADFVIRLGDRAIVEAAVDALEAPVAFRRRMKRALMRGRTVEDVANDRAGETEHAGLFAALEAAGPDAGRAVIEDLLKLAGIAAVGGRTTSEIAERFLERAAAHSVTLEGEAKRSLSALLGVDAPAREALAALREMTATASEGLRAAVEALALRLDAFAAAGLDLAAMRFSTRFGRRLDYYDGLVFEVATRRDGAALAGGGRYDGLIAALGAPAPVTGVGFALWLDRFAKAAS